MNSAYQRYRYAVIWLGVLLLAACDGETSFLNPQGTGAAHIADLWWVMLLIGVAVYLQVILLLVIALFRKRFAGATEDAPPDVRRPSRNAQTFILANGVALPIVILIIVFGLNLITLVRLSPADSSSNLIIEVIGHRWWWEVRYPQHNIVTANEIYIPAGEQVELRLTSEDVIHSLWVPTLNGKADLIPGQTNRMFLQTDAVGEYEGMCAEFCGVQHAKMRFLVTAVASDDFAAWLDQQQQVAPVADGGQVLRGQQIFLGAACVYCHTVRGTSASGVIGPDLTHLASRKTLGAGAVPNTPGNLAGWIIDSQAIKPGNLMPPVYIEGEDLQALLAYLATLQ